MQPDLLSQLNDIQTPDPIGWWPLAWGWYLVLILLLTASFILFKLIKTKFEQSKAKKQALRELTAMDKTLTPLQQVTVINNILKRVVLAYAPRQDVANLTGSQWAEWLNGQGTKGHTIDSDLLTLAYKATCDEAHSERYQQQARAWIEYNLPLPKVTDNNQTREVNHV